MITREGEKLKANGFGKLTSELYISPKSALILKGLCKRGFSDDTAVLSQICSTQDMPHVWASRRFEEEITDFYMNHKTSFQDVDLEEEYPAVYGTMILSSWLDERTPAEMEVSLGVEPGLLYAYIHSAEWILHSARRISNFLHAPESQTERLRRLERRMKEGVKEELLPLIEVPYVGRVRARRLFTFGARSPEDVKRLSQSQLTRILGEVDAAKKIHLWLKGETESQPLLDDFS